MNIQRKNSAHHFRMQSEREQTLVALDLQSPHNHILAMADLPYQLCFQENCSFFL